VLNEVNKYRVIRKSLNKIIIYRRRWFYWRRIATVKNWTEAAEIIEQN